MARILVVDDETGIRLAVRDELRFEGFDVELAEDGAAGLAAILRSPPDLVVLDVMLPGRNGFEICRELRERHIQVPIIMLTARNQDVDKVRGLEIGADDYLTKPFSLGELIARIRAVLRRTTAPAHSQGGTAVLHGGAIRIDLKRHEAFKAERTLDLTDTEFRLLTLLLQRRGEAITRDDFLQEIWGDDVNVTHRTIDAHIAALRRKIEDEVEHPAYIVSIRNVGYRFNDPTT